MVDNRSLYSSARAVQVTSSIASGGATPKLTLAGGSIATVAIISTSSLVFKFQGSLDGSTNWHDLSAALTLSQGDVHRVDCSGFQNVRLLASAGSGSVDFALSVEGSSDEGGSAELENISGLQADINTTVAGNAVTRTFSAVSSGAKGQFVHNNDATYSIWYKRVTVGAASATITSTNKHGIILPGVTAYIELNPGSTLDIMNSSGAATTVTFNAGEF